MKKTIKVIIFSTFIMLLNSGCGGKQEKNNQSSETEYQVDGTYSGNNVSLTISGDSWDCELNDGGPTINSSGILIGNSLYVVDENGKTNVGYVNSSGVTLTMGGHVFLKKQTD